MLLEKHRAAGGPLAAIDPLALDEIDEHLLEPLGRVLGDTGAGRGRAALHRVRAADPLPDLPDLVRVWSTPDDELEAAAVLGRLREAEATLTAYRRGLHERIDEATAELIVRYRADPTRALLLLVD